MSLVFCFHKRDRDANNVFERLTHNKLSWDIIARCSYLMCFHVFERATYLQVLFLSFLPLALHHRLAPGTYFHQKDRSGTKFDEHQTQSSAPTTSLVSFSHPYRHHSHRCHYPYCISFTTIIIFCFMFSILQHACSLRGSIDQRSTSQADNAWSSDGTSHGHAKERKQCGELTQSPAR